MSSWFDLTVRSVEHGSLTSSNHEYVEIYLMFVGWEGLPGRMLAEAEKFVGSCKGSELRPFRTRLNSVCICSTELLKS